MIAQTLISHHIGEMALEPYELPDLLPPDGIRVEAAVTTISPGTEVANYLGTTTQRTPESTEAYVPGYSFAGTVLAVGSQHTRFAPGDRICGPLPHASHAVEARPERLARMTKIPDGVSFRDASFTQLGCIALNGVRRARIEMGQSVAIVGAGLVGLLAGRLARLDGAWPLVSLDLVPGRRALSARYGAHLALDPRDPDTRDRLEAVAPGGFQVVIEATGSPQAFLPSLALAHKGGRIVLLGSTRGAVTNFDPYADVHVRGLDLVAAHVSSTPTAGANEGPWTEAANRAFLLSLIEHGELDINPLVTHTIAPKEAPDAFAALADRSADHLGVVIDWAGQR
ncbi:2-desacetyl-2-hydroxyethyl bacteriochlorophyllide A dehydrogenase [Micromonospora rhizosphaerae]|uniref:2-desacetyl-2-hydroxyethyl bacteriochlorophyllide A dehydrogenase n=1 Tax=Micromonospora rhizosphaerae TaxID=568872 RepID=A0A1C6T259_9ACTN|nr:zinc-binding alcohol dehydrogenase [Micromonospora rhizosphaerae]SCL35652.1 2-desacetyl-2-hydroxyethyl bacteriochlorophyllide A dehydrogenase [Micromonospora rhizosphaerae]